MNQELEPYNPRDREIRQAFNQRLAYLTVALWLVGTSLFGACISKRAESVHPTLVMDPATPQETLSDLDQSAKPPTQQKRRGIPLKPEPFQKTPPCSEDAGEEAINGACYVALKRKPPCGPILMEDPKTNTCYRAVAKPEKPPTSIER